MGVIEGHRIGGRLAPENSRKAVEEASRLGFVESVEFDVRGTCDGEVVVFHGPEIMGDERIGSYADLGNLENGESVPRFDEIFQMCSIRGLSMNVEIKENDDRVIAQVIDRIFETRAQARVSSFDREVLEKVRRRARGIPLGLLVNDSWKYADGVPVWEEVPEDFTSFHGSFTSDKVKGDSVNFCAATITKDVIKKCQECDLDAMVWFPGDSRLDISDDKEHNLVGILSMMPDVICTNRPDLLAKLTLLN